MKNRNQTKYHKPKPKKQNLAEMIEDMFNDGRTVISDTKQPSTEQPDSKRSPSIIYLILAAASILTIITLFCFVPDFAPVAGPIAPSP